MTYGGKRLNKSINISYQIEQRRTVVFDGEDWAIQYDDGPVIRCPILGAVKLLREADRPIRTIVETVLVINEIDDN